MSEDFTTRLQLQLREVALREERRGTLGRRLAAARYAAPRPATVAWAAAAAAVLAVLVIAGGLRWSREETIAIPRVIDTVPLADSLGTMASGFGSVWAMDSTRGDLLRVDPRTHAILSRRRVGRDAIVNAGAGAVWVLRPPELLRIDPATGRTTGRTRLPLPAGGGVNRIPVDIEMVGDVPWVVSPTGAGRIDPRTGALRQVIRVHGPGTDPFPYFLTAAPDGIWVLTRANRIQRYDAGSGRLAAELPVRLPNAVSLLPTAEGVLLGTRDGEVALADRRDGAIVWQHAVGGNLGGLPLEHAGSLWVPATGLGRDRLVQLDPKTGETRSSTSLPEFGFAGLAIVGRGFWIASPGGKVTVLDR